MKCLLCDLKNDDNVDLKNHYIHFHLIDKNNYFFKELFLIDTANKYSNRCEECRMLFDTSRKKKNQFFKALRSVWWFKQFPLEYF